MFKLIVLGCLTLMWANFSYSKNLEYTENDLTTSYGESVEINFQYTPTDRNQNRPWEVVGQKLPVGMQLTKINKNSFNLEGIIQFSGKWCFLANIKDNDNNLLSKRICLFSEKNENLDYPIPQIERELKNAIKDQSYNIDFPIKLGPASSEIFVDIYESGLPNNLELEFSNTNNVNKVTISGTPLESGIFIFTLVINDEYETIVYKQLQLLVNKPTIDRDDNDGIRCDIGYYYDDYLGYCRQINGRYCPPNTFYDYQSNSCKPYSRPRHITCGRNYYFDHFLQQCIRLNSRRCPYNYEWDSWRARCVRLPYTCGFNQRYSWPQRRCVNRNYPRTCNRGYSWNYYRNKCVRNYRNCPRGQYYDSTYNICKINRKYCGPNRVWNRYTNRCESRPRQCSFGFHWNFQTRRCVPNRAVRRRCRAGLHWSYSQNGCVRNQYDPPRPPRQRPGISRPRPRPMPMPMPKPRPGMSRPRPRPMPMPMPRPRPGISRPRPRPMPMPRLRPGISRPRPRPMPMPMPRPRPGMSRPRPRPMPGMSRPRPMRRPCNPRVQDC